MRTIIDYDGKPIKVLLEEDIEQVITEMEKLKPVRQSGVFDPDVYTMRNDCIEILKSYTKEQNND